MGTQEVVVSIIIPCYNDGQFLPDAIRSARSNQRGLHEIIVVNDGSSDPQTLSILDDLRGSVVQVIDQQNEGLGAARNRGITAARGRYILPLDSDNQIRAEYIDRGIELLDSKPNLDVIYGNAQFFGAKHSVWRVPEYNLCRLLLHNYIDACAVYRKSAWERCGGYDTNMPFAGFEDWDLWVRIAGSGGGFYHLDEVLFDYRIRTNSMTAAMRDPKIVEAVRKYVHSKTIPVTVGEYGRRIQSWDFVTDEIRHRPFKSMLNLLLRAYFPKVRAKLLSSRLSGSSSSSS